MPIYTDRDKKYHCAPIGLVGDLRNYIQMRVRVEGTIARQPSGKKLINIKSIEKLKMSQMKTRMRTPCFESKKRRSLSTWINRKVMVAVDFSEYTLQNRGIRRNGRQKNLGAELFL